MWYHARVSKQTMLVRVEKRVLWSERFWLFSKLTCHKIVYVASFACVLEATYNVHVFKLDEHILLRPTALHLVHLRPALSFTQKLAVAFRANFVVFQNDTSSSVPPCSLVYSKATTSF